MKAALTLFVVLLCPGWLLAQDATPGPQDTVPATQATPPATPVTGAPQGTIRGCLVGSPSSGTYTIADRQSGVTYNLQGSADTLRTLVGTEVEVSGQPSNASNSGPNSTAGTPASGGTNPTDQPAGMPAQAFQVTDTKKVADHCEAAKPSSSNSKVAPSRESGVQQVAMLMSPAWQTATPAAPAQSTVPQPAAPQPGTAAPAPATAAPTPSTAAPIPSTAAPTPSTAAPIPSTAAPTPSTAAPVPNTAAPPPQTTQPNAARKRGTTPNQVPCSAIPGATNPDGSTLPPCPNNPGNIPPTTQPPNE